MKIPLLFADPEKVALIVGALFMDDPERAADALRSAGSELDLGEDELKLFLAEHILRTEKVLRVFVPEMPVRRPPGRVQLAQ